MKRRRPIRIDDARTGDPFTDLVAAVFVVAVKDALHGDPDARRDAVSWLWTVAPDWAEKLGLERVVQGELFAMAGD